MSIVATQPLLGQSPDVVQSYLGPSQHHQPNPDNQTDLYVYGPGYVRGVFPVQTTGIIGIYRSNQCIALKIICSKTDPRYKHFIYNREMASRLFERVIGNDYAYWHEVEADPRANNTVHYVYCMGHRIATTWDAVALDGTITSDVSIFLDNRCGPTDNSELTQPIVAVPATTDAGQEFQRRRPAGGGLSAQGAAKPAQEIVFTDIAGNRYAAEILKAANTYHLLAGYEDGTFQPGTVVTRDQGLGMLLKAMEQMITVAGTMVIPDQITTAPFADVPVDHTSVRQFYLAKQTGILSGDKDQNVYPAAPMSRAELTAMVHNGLAVVVEANYSPTTTPGDVIEPVSTAVTFTDIAGHWGEAVIQAMAAYGLATSLQATGSQFGPEAPAQRDYTAATLVRLLEVSFSARPGQETRPIEVKTFPDIGQDIYKEEIVRATNRYGLVTGYDDQKFHPTDPVSREQAVTLLVNAMQNMVANPDTIQIPETLSDPPPFPDVNAGENAPKIQFAKTAGLISSDLEENFRPLAQLSRAELMAMVDQGLTFVVKANFGSAMNLAEVIQTPDQPVLAFTDIPADHWAADLLPDLAQAGIATPFNEASTEFKPDQPCLRNYAAAAMVRMVETKFTSDGSSRPAPAINFSDIRGNPFEAEILQAANQYKLVAGYEDGSFKPTSPVSREQAVAMLVDALKQKIVDKEMLTIPDYLTQPPFTDVDINRWSAPRLYLAKQIGMISGDDLGRFNPEAPLSRAQLMAMTYQALNYGIWADFGPTNQPIEQVFTQDPNHTYTFSDVPSDHWAARMVTPMGTIGLALPFNPAVLTQFSPDTAAYRDYTVATAVNMIAAPYAEPVPQAPVALTRGR